MNKTDSTAGDILASARALPAISTLVLPAA